MTRKGKTILTATYDKMLYAYAYTDILFNQKVDQFLLKVQRLINYRSNVRWIKKNGGPWNG